MLAAIVSPLSFHPKPRAAAGGSLPLSALSPRRAVPPPPSERFFFLRSYHSFSHSRVQISLPSSLEKALFRKVNIEWSISTSSRLKLTFYLPHAYFCHHWIEWRPYEQFSQLTLPRSIRAVLAVDVTTLHTNSINSWPYHAPYEQY